MRVNQTKWSTRFIGCVCGLLIWLVGLSVGWSDAIALEPVPIGEPEIEQPAPMRYGIDASDISLEKVTQFVRAYLNVLELIEGREGELQGAETDLESVRIEQEIETEAFALIEAEGLTMQEYLQLLRLANTDPDFGERIAAQLQEAVE